MSDAGKGALARPDAVANAGRVVVKVGSSTLTTDTGGIDESRVAALVDALAERRASGIEVVLVTSGAIAAGLEPLNLRSRPRDLATQQAAASIGQGLLMHRYTEAFAAHGVTVGQVLMTAEDVVRRSHYRNAQRTLYRLLEMGALPIVNENDTVATDEIRFGDNDRLAALVAHLVHADLFVMLSDVDALYDAPPSRRGATRITEVTDPAQLDYVDVGRRGSSVGTGGNGHQARSGANCNGSGHSRGSGTCGCHQASARRRRRWHVVRADGTPNPYSLAVVGARGDAPWAGDSGRRCGHSDRAATRVPASSRHHGGRRFVRRGRPSRPG